MNDKPLMQVEVAGATKRFKVIDDGDPCSCVPETMWRDPNVIAEPKSDGHRFKLHIFQDLNRIDSRRPSVESGLYVERTDAVPHIRDLAVPQLAGTILDGELCAGKDSNSVAHALGSLATNEERRQLHYVIFDILFFKGNDVRDRQDRVRRELIELCKKNFFQESEIIRLMPRPINPSLESKKQVLIDAMSTGQEGIMLKDISQPYGKGWSKVKREARYDVVVVGYTDPKPTSKKKGQEHETITRFAAAGLIGAIVFGQYVDGKLVEMGQCSGMTDDVRVAVSRDKNKHLGQVFEIAAQERFPSGKFRHPRFMRWRSGEKLAKDCIYRPDEV
jgi:ATP-dependent DNA ligase